MEATSTSNVGLALRRRCQPRTLVAQAMVRRASTSVTVLTALCPPRTPLGFGWGQFLPNLIYLEVHASMESEEEAIPTGVVTATAQLSGTLERAVVCMEPDTGDKLLHRRAMAWFEEAIWEEIERWKAPRDSHVEG